MTTRRNTWSSNGYIEPDTTPPGEGHGMSKAVRRLVMKAQGSEPAFRCPECEIRFKIVYGTWAHEKWKETTHYCKDCVKENPVRIRKV